ncbi:MAG: translation initiation factor IF-2 N-terminal domain-containing protein, partial [Candidatus Harrisonbacteria bacterium]|nr:translation initiation factor IF-2 N-terminal domain-containing protein [Candidatus Harrisonbacteria bacterium]
ETKREIGESIEIPDIIAVKEFSEKTGVNPAKVIGELMKNGILANINQQIDFETAQIIADDLGILNYVIFKDTDGAGCHKITFNSTGTLNAILVDCATGEPPPPPPPPPPSGVIFFENFNSYTDGNLGGQGGWTTPNTVNWTVNPVSPIEGFKDLKVTGTTDTLGVAFVAINDSVGTTGNLVTATWRFKINNVSAGGGRGLTVILRNSLNQNITDVSFAVSQPIIGTRHNDDFVPFQEISLGQVYKVTVEYDKLNNQYRMRINDGPFSSFGPLSDTLANGSNVEKLLIGSDRINGSTFIDELIIQQ